MDGRLMNWLLKRGRGDRWFVGTGGGGGKPAIEISGVQLRFCAGRLQLLSSKDNV